MSDPTTPIRFKPDLIIAGGQTGVDRAAFDVAIALGIEHGGWCPKGRLAEDGTIPSRYNVRENDSRDYRDRTRQNVVDSDATLILYEDRLQGGTSLTARYCRELEVPYLTICMDRDDATAARQWLETVRPPSLNIAGPRESKFPGIQERTMRWLLALLSPASV